MSKDIQQLKDELKVLKKGLRECAKECERIQKTAEYDFLTEIYNRRGFLREAGRFLGEMETERRQQARRQSNIIRSIALIFIDVDDLKIVNDRHGHKKGDNYLRAIARVLTKAVREIDVVGRWGGDEFVVALINAGDKEALIVAQKLKRRIAALSLFKRIDPNFRCSASFGLIATDGSILHPNYGLHALIEKADRAMYEAKIQRGKGVIVSFSEIIR